MRNLQNDDFHLIYAKDAAADERTRVALDRKSVWVATVKRVVFKVDE